MDNEQKHIKMLEDLNQECMEQGHVMKSLDDIQQELSMSGTFTLMGVTFDSLEDLMYWRH